MIRNYRLIDTPVYLAILAIISILFISLAMHNAQAQDFADFEDSTGDDLLVSDDEVTSQVSFGWRF